ncbi:3'(2'),5'-bisphosphate nucleotidase CysQ [Acuticoccus sp. I52.16.1]|uniref:inositol monophosphatase family protein n=1 Tax=Acuticoccus sp. I52.16.1 TaxID=2928472 RepID=UPI001FD50539|nr:3'(2'),5'-bisphosphate nucleotidase CysQ [Acuticoccus sp. I52.16.1]UOM36251.1 3'(2'),5'-bisphosphate nucleotidase CysQ [Acuticoccus sp. I52.16.1]
MAAESDLDLLVRAVRRAGQVALAWRGTARSWSKADGSPVSEADLAANDALQDVLCAARPDYGWLSEENGGKSGSGRSFVVDPIDGTRAYVAGGSDWTVVAAVLDGGRPVAGAIFRPVVGTLYSAARGGGAMRDGRPAKVSRHAGLQAARVAMPAPLYRDGPFQEAGVERAKYISSMALRLAKAGDGRLDAVITKQGPHHWDLAAADLFVHEAGGTLTDLAGETLDYAAETTSHGAIVAGSPDLSDSLRRLAAGHDPAM